MNIKAKDLCKIEINIFEKQFPTPKINYTQAARLCSCEAGATLMPYIL